MTTPTRDRRPPATAAGFEHLPPGHPPGKMSAFRRRNRRAGGCIAPAFIVIGLVVGVGFVGIAVLFASVANLPPIAVVGVAMAAAALPSVFVVVGIVMLIRLRPRVAKGLALSADAVELRRGERVDVTLSIERPDRERGPIEVGLLCVEYWSEVSSTGTDTSSGPVPLEATNHETWETVARPTGRHRLSFEVPAGGGYSYEGTALAVAWRVSARRAGGGRRAPRFDVPVWVAP